MNNPHNIIHPFRVLQETNLLYLTPPAFSFMVKSTHYRVIFTRSSREVEGPARRNLGNRACSLVPTPAEVILRDERECNLLKSLSLERFFL